MLNIISPINQLGYGIAGLNICKELDKISPIALFPLAQPTVTCQDDFDIVNDMIKNARMPDFNAPCLRIWHQHDMSQFVGNGLKIGFPIFELDEFNDLEKHHLGQLDKIFVCSEWAKRVVLKEIGLPPEHVHVVPLGVDRTIFKESTVDNHEKDGTIFFNCGKWEVRKGHDIIPEAFSRAFSSEDNVELWMMCDNPFVQGDEKMRWIDLYKSSPLGGKISFLDRAETHEGVYNIMSNVSCGVFPARAEGWNLELLEMMSCGKPVIATDYSAHTEFCTKENAFLVSIDKEEKAYDGKWFHGEIGNWASIGEDQIDQISSHMRNIHDNKIKTNPQGVITAEKYTWKNSAREAHGHLKEYDNF
jgi:glycosyltransferase involved in cell wall biosynthesis